MNPPDSLWKITKPCAADWEKMRGDDKRRFCEHCQKHVHNVSAMNATERAAFADPANQHECVFYSQRTDGKVADLSLLTAIRRWLPFLRFASWSAMLALLPAMLTGCMGVRCPPSRICPLPNNNPATSPQSTNQTTNVEAPR